MGKKLVVLFLAVVLLLASVPALAANTRTEVKLKGGMEALNVRSGPGTGYDVVTWVHNGSVIDVVSVGAKWSKIVVSNSGNTGYINNGYIKKLPASTGGSSSTSTGSGTATAGRVTGKSVNLRSGAGTSNKVVKSLASGTKLKMWGEKNGWRNVTTLAGTSGWISKQYVKEGFTSVTTAAVNIRKTANGALIRTLAKGTSVNVISMTANWSKVKAGGTTGYVYTKYLK